MIRLPTIRRSPTTTNFGLTIAFIFLAVPPAAAEEPNGNATIRGRLGESEIVITTTERLAGAIHSLTWNGKEFIDSFDHGRQLQSASNFDAGSPFTPETFNPTEAGSRADGAGPSTTSKLLELRAAGSELETLVQMAFWLRPGEKSDGHLAKNKQPLSNHLLRKRVHIGYRELPNVVDYQVTFTLPPDEHHTYAQFEALTGYMPAEFSSFWTFDPASGKITSLSDGPGEQSLPVVFSTADAKYAMGIYSPDQPSPGYATVGYGRFRFPTEKVVKWNCVFRERDNAGVRGGDRAFRCLVVIGDLAKVQKTLQVILAR